MSPPPALLTTEPRSVLRDEKADVDIGISGIIPVTAPLIPDRPDGNTPVNAAMPPGLPRVPLRLRNPETLDVNSPCRELILTFIPQVAIYPPAITLGEPAATLVHPEIPSPIRPAPLPLTFTVDEPAAIGAT